MQQTTTSPAGFSTLGIATTLLGILDKAKFTTPTPIQEKSIPVAIDGKDVIGIAQTGTGKTLAFGIPMIQRLAMHKGRGLVILPTRELALQVDESLARIGKPIGMRTAVLIGGENIKKQITQLKGNPHVIIATPGRLIDHMEQKTVKLDDVRILVLDEADRMLDMGFAPQINRILVAVPKKRQTMLFSATMPNDIVDIAKKHMQLPVRVEVAPAGTASERVSQELFIVRKDDKLRLLEKVLNDFDGTVLVFSRTKHGAKKICKAVRAMKHTAAEIHANRSLNQRREALDGFKNGKYRVLVATDIAARGIDVKGIGLVINYDLPDSADDYVHRIGRTGRAGHEGKAYSFATPDQQSDIRAIERLIRGKLPVSDLPKDLPAARSMPSEPRDERRPRHGQGRPLQRSGARPDHKRRDERPARAHKPLPTYRRLEMDEDEAPAYRYDPKAGSGGRR
ncbi:DEAD/DEAH box helicase [Candidatus Uhrbacteria bacterium]|nr:DEAD/DEAH box helicase [Candidatus Uhrbacteria bacterium]